MIVLCRPSLHGSLAQSVEQLAFNQLVVRSSRTRPTIFSFACPWAHLSALTKLVAANCFRLDLRLVDDIPTATEAVQYRFRYQLDDD